MTVSKREAIGILSSYLGQLILVQDKKETGSGQVACHIVSRYDGWTPVVSKSYTAPTMYDLLLKIVPGIFAQKNTSYYFTKEYQYELYRLRKENERLSKKDNPCNTP